jgi:hypothetical protein
MVKTTMFINNVQTFKTTHQKKVTANKRQQQLSGKIRSVYVPSNSVSTTCSQGICN